MKEVLLLLHEVIKLLLFFRLILKDSALHPGDIVGEFGLEQIASLLRCLCSRSLDEGIELVFRKGENLVCFSC